MQFHMVQGARTHVEQLEGDGPPLPFHPARVAQLLQSQQEPVDRRLGQLDLPGQLLQADGALQGQPVQHQPGP